ncbi:MAG: TrkA family potassium uptake protein [Anaerolineales bacterium]|nr:TrkA family potassium uptake protein [Anaerolineales bacterium]
MKRVFLRLRRNQRWRRFRAGLRDTFLLVREFLRPILFFVLAIWGGGALYHHIAMATDAAVGQTWGEAVYQVLGLTFLQPLGDNLPTDFRLQMFYFLMPIIGISILAQGLTDFGFLFFNRRARTKEWEMAVASTFSEHIVLVGLGHLGFRVTRELCGLGQDVAVIEMKPNEELTAVTKSLGVPVIHDDARRESALVAAGVAKAHTLVVCTQNDSANLQIAFKARRLNPDIRVVARIFDDDFAASLEENFDFQAMSATGMAAPKFAAAATGMDITRPITVEGESFSLASFDIPEHSRLIGKTMGFVEQTYDVSVVLLRRNSISDFHPEGEKRIEAGDVLAILGGPDQISRLAQANQ